MAQASEDTPLLTSSGLDSPTPHRVSFGTLDSSLDVVQTVSGRTRSVGKIAPDTSVYSYMLFMPEISRKRHGHYCTFQTLNACLLFTLVVTLQLSLTAISGVYILDNHYRWKSSIIYDARVQTIYPWVELGADLMSDPSFATIKDYYKKYKMGSTEECCPDSTCASSGRKCCKRGTNYALVQTSTNYSALQSEITSSKLASTFEKGDGDENANAAKSLCTQLGERNYTCSPPSLRYLDKWDTLDRNGDGIWSRDEALEDVDNLGCQLQLSQEDMFNSMCHTVIMDIQDGAAYRGVQQEVPQSIKEKWGVPRKYFDWFGGVVALCSTASPGHCSRLLAEGVFTSAMDPDLWRVSGLRSIDDSMEYCIRLLQPGGLCAKMMPSSYSLYRSMVTDKCGALTYSIGPMYRNPHNPHDGIRILIPTFGKVGEFTAMTFFAFKFFLLLLLMTWFYNFMEEMKQIGAVCDLLVNVPVINVFPFMPQKYRESVHARASRVSQRLGNFLQHGESEHSCTLDKAAVTIDNISRPHQVTLACIVIVRLSLLIFMTVVGTVFLLSNHFYLDLLLNAVALAFIFELDQFVFTFLVSDAIKKQLEQIKPICFHSAIPEGCFPGVFFKREVWAFVTIPLCAFFVVVWNTKHNLMPVLDALTCLCEKQGNHCAEADRFPSSWWDNYWQQRAMVV